MNLDFLIPGQVIEQCKLQHFNLLIGIEGTPAQAQYPTVKVSVNNVVIYDQPTVNYVEIPFDATDDIDSYQVLIEYYNRPNNATVVDDQGNISENQHVKISKVVVNEVDIIQSQIIYNLGNYTKNLTDEQKAYYLAHGHAVEPTHSLEMYENGFWTLNFKMPVLLEFIKLKKSQAKHEQSWFTDLNHKIYDTINNIRSIEKKINQL